MTYLWIALGFTVLAVGFSLAFSAAQKPAPPNLSDELIRAEAREGSRLVAIRWYRQLHRVGSRRAREAVEQLLAKE